MDARHEGGIARIYTHNLASTIKNHFTENINPSPREFTPRDLRFIIFFSASARTPKIDKDKKFSLRSVSPLDIEDDRVTSVRRCTNLSAKNNYSTAKKKS